MGKWHTIFSIYFTIAVLSSILMIFVHNYRSQIEENSIEVEQNFFKKVTIAGRLFLQDPKMKYMFGLNAAFGFSASFVSSYVAGSFETAALADDESKLIGALSAATFCVAAIFS